MLPSVRIARGVLILLSLLLLPLLRVCLWSVLASLVLAADARADAVLLHFLPPTSGVVAGYKVYSAFQTTGAITSAPLDIGARAPDSTGVASYSLANLDPSRSYSVEMTAYDSSGVESVRSNRITLAPRGETLGDPLWQSDFAVYAPGVAVPGFRDFTGDPSMSSASGLFAVAYFADGNAALGTAVSPGAVSSRYMTSASANWGSYEISGRAWSNTQRSELAIAARITGTSPAKWFELGQDPSAAWRLAAPNEPALTCSRGPATGLTQSFSRWTSFKLRVTRANGLTRVRARVWKTGALEPIVWMADCWTTLAAPADSGAFALLRGAIGSGYFDDVAVRPVNGTLDPIPGP